MEANQYPLVSIISVNYNGASFTCEMINSLKKISYPSIEIIIIDNASTESTQIIEDSFNDIKLIKSKKNLGFAGGNNLGIKHCLGKYILLLNNDTEVDENFLEPLVSKLENDKSVGAVSPKVYYYNTNIVQFAGSNAINQITGRGGFIGEKQIDEGQFDEDARCNHTHGAAMLFPRSIVQELGLMSDIYFLYYEELDFCEKIKRAGYQMWYISNSKIYHKESMSVGKISNLKTYYQTRNRILFMKRNVSNVHFLLFCVYFTLISFPVNIIKYIIKFDWQSLRAYLKGIKWNFKFSNFVSDPLL